MLGILPRHAPLLTTLQPGEIRVKKGATEEAMAVGGGFLQVARDQVLILADTAERADEIDEARAEEARRRARENLARPWQRSAPAGRSRRGSPCAATKRGFTVARRRRSRRPAAAQARAPTT